MENPKYIIMGIGDIFSRMVGMKILVEEKFKTGNLSWEGEREEFRTDVEGGLVNQRPVYLHIDNPPC